MKIMLIVKAIAGFLVLGAMGGTAYLMKEYTGTVKDMPGTMMERQRKVELTLKQKAEHGVKSDNEPGEKAFHRAKELLAMESMAEAEEKLKYIVSFYPSAKCAGDARRILGEINVDRLLDPEWKEGKQTVVVKSGDNYSVLVKKHQTTFDSLVHLSRLQHSEANRLRAGHKLTIMPLNMRVVIDVRRKTLTLWEGGVFIKEYPIVNMNYKGTGAVKRLKLGPTHGWFRERSYPSHSEYYRGASKIITLSDKSLAIRAVSEDTEEDISRGFLLSPADMEELPLLLRSGNDIEIRH